VLFAAIDQDDERGRLNWQECRKALPLLEKWRISEKQARQKFPDDWTPSMWFGEFAQWCITRRFGRLDLHLDALDAEATLKAFKDWDTDGTGTISADELADVLVALDESFTREDAMELFEAADMNKDGSIDYLEFTQWVAQ